jgi:CRISPR-associated protein Csb1
MRMADDLTRFDAWMTEHGPAAMVLREHLQPVGGDDSVVFPPTFAPEEGSGRPSGYVIDVLRDGTKVCLIDSVGAQANRLEPLFKKSPYRDLVPQIVIEAGSQHINLLDAGHRAADGVVRFSTLGEPIQQAFTAWQRGDARPLAVIAPTSLIFGAWDSRETQAKAPRLVNSEIRAYDVEELRRASQYIPPLEYAAEGLVDETLVEEDSKAEGRLGLSHVPARARGGVLVRGSIRRQAELNLVALRSIGTLEDNGQLDEANTLTLRRYLLGLALVAFTKPQSHHLRQGCLLETISIKS